MIDRLVIFGATGELTGRYLLPGLAALLAGGHLSERFELVAAGREDWNDDRYRDWAAGWLGRRAPRVDAGATTTLVRSSRYERLDFADPARAAACVAGEGPVAVYLALPAAVFPLRSRRSTEPSFRPTARWSSRSRSERTSTAHGR